MENKITHMIDHDRMLEINRMKQLSYNCKWLIKQIDQIHSVLCPGDIGTWQDRVKNTVFASKEISNKRKNRLWMCYDGDYIFD